MWPWSSRAWVQRCALLNTEAVLPEVHGHLQSASPLFYLYYSNRNICLHYYNRLLFTFQPFSTLRLPTISIIYIFVFQFSVINKQQKTIYSNPLNTMSSTNHVTMISMNFGNVRKINNQNRRHNLNFSIGNDDMLLSR